MATILDLIRMQREFDEYHHSTFDWSERITDENIGLLEHLLVCMVGEFGEAANLVKKVVRGDKRLDDVRSDLAEELADLLIYVLKLIYQLDIDIEEEFKKKLTQNAERFKRYKKTNKECNE